MLDILRQQLHDDLTAGARWCLALSGGVDSTALLHAVVQLGKAYPGNSIRAVHVNHHLHPDAGAWAATCRALCDALGVELTCCDVAVAAGNGNSPEAAARRARYGALTKLLLDDERLLTAHHRDDQVETFLLRMLRGAGPHGLGGIEPRRPFGRGWLVRPLLDVSRHALVAYAGEQNLSWIEDPANIDTKFDRNFLRHRVLPVLHERWPGLGETVARAARLSGEAARMLDELAGQDMRCNGAALPVDTLAVETLAGLSWPRRRNVIRYWLRRHGLAPPAEARLRVGLEQLLHARSDRMPLLEWGGGQIRRYRGSLYALDYDPDPAGKLPREFSWDGRDCLDLGALRGRLKFLSGHPVPGRASGHWIVRFRIGGERFSTGGQHKTVKHLFQELGIVPWMRAHVPLLYRADCLVAVGDLWQSGDAGAPVAWEGHPPVR